MLLAYTCVYTNYTQRPTIGYRQGSSDIAFTIPIIGTIKFMIPKTTKNGKPIKIKLNIPEIPINTHITIWNNKACTEKLFTSSS